MKKNMVPSQPYLKKTWIPLPLSSQQRLENPSPPETLPSIIRVIKDQALPNNDRHLQIIGFGLNGD